MIEVGLIGYGLAGKTFHAPLVGAVGRMRLAAIATSRETEVAADWPGVRVERAASALIADPAIDLIVIATPNETHAALARAALDAGKHVVIDKPFAVGPAEGDSLIAFAKARGRMLSVFQNRRWDGDFLTVRRLLDDQAVGTLMLYEARWDRFRLALRDGWKDDAASKGNGLLPDLGAHLIDQALLLFGPPDALNADIGAQRSGSPVDDYFELTFHYGAMRATLSASTLIVAARPRFSLHGTGGSFVKYGLDPQEAALSGGARPGDTSFGEDDPARFGTLSDPSGNNRRIPTERGDYSRYYEGIADAVLDGTPPPVDPADSVAGLRLIEIARQSAEEGRRLTVD